MPTSTFVAAGTTTVAPSASQPVPDTGSGVERLASELRALRLQAQSTEAELATLRQPAQARDGLGEIEAGWVTASISLALGLLALGWWLQRRRPRRPMRRGDVAVVESGFASQTPSVLPASATPTGGAAPAPAVPVGLDRPPVAAAVAAASRSRPLVHDSAFRPSSLDVTFVEHDAMDASMMPMPMPRHDQPFAAPDAGLEFDPQAAATEVERVRKSLAAKRSERSRLFAPGSESAWRDDDPTDESDSARQSDMSQSDMPHAGIPGTPTAPTTSAGVDVWIDFPDHAEQSTPTDPAGETSEPHEQAPGADREVDVSVSLIQELRGLGLWSEARELAKEVVNSAQAPLDADIASSLHRLQHGTPASGGERRKKERG